ncbi:MAG: flippase-like domain-containing protein [Solirubrobacteraceae bacterium]
MSCGALLQTPAITTAEHVSRRLAESARALSEGVTEAHALVTEAHALVTAANWKLVGALGYYAFDNAVLWAAFHAYGRTPPIGVGVMGYLVGSLAGVLPLPAGLGAVDGGLVGALVLYGEPAAPAAAAVLLYRGISLALPAVLGAIGWAWSPAVNRRLPLGGRERLPGSAPTERRAAPELATAPTDSTPAHRSLRVDRKFQTAAVSLVRSRSHLLRIVVDGRLTTNATKGTLP